MPTNIEAKSQNEGSSADEQEPKPPPKPSKLKSLWAKSGLNGRILKTMLKGACPPTIAVALYQYTPFALSFPTIGYLVAIMSILSLTVLPRAKFFQNMMFNLIAISIGSCVALLTCYSAVQARLHTSTPTSTSNLGASGTTLAVQYNSSASAVSAVWLFFNIMFANAARFSRPQLQIPIIMYSIFANVSGTTAPLFATMTQAEAFVKQLLTAFLSGFGIATVVHLLIFPMSSRDVVFGEFQQYFGALQGVLKAQRHYLQCMEHGDMFDTKGNEGAEVSELEKASKELKAKVAGLQALHGKVHADMPFAKREVAIGYLDAKDLGKVFSGLRAIFLPMLGLASIVDIFERIANMKGWNGKVEGHFQDEPNEASTMDPAKKEEVNEWNEIMQTLHEPFESVSNAMADGLQHVSYVLKITKGPKGSPAKDADIEAKGETAVPGDEKFCEYLKLKDKEFWEQRAEALKVWCRQKGVNFPDDLPTEEFENSRVQEIKLEKINSRNSSRQQLYLILYMEYLLHSASQAILALVNLADEKVATDCLQKRRLILPEKKRLMKWILHSLSLEDGSNEQSTDSAETEIYTVNLGQAFYKHKNPEHLPPTNAWQKLGEGVRRISRFLKSTEMSFGFRVACATMSIAVVAFLQDTQEFFVAQRLVWAMIMVAIGMTMTSGSGVFGLVARVVGTCMAMVISLVIWYIAGARGVPGAVIPLLYIVLFIVYYFFVKYPRYLPVFMVSQVTLVLIAGYELQVDKIGIVSASSNGQLYYPIYELAPYRLATVSAGCLVAFIWMYFPYPITARSTMRKQLGETVYLLGNYYSVVHHTVQMRLESTGGDINNKRSPAAELEKVRIKLHGKLLALQSQLQAHLSFIPLEFSFGGSFPLDEYKFLVKDVQSLRDYISLIAYSTRDYLHDPENVSSTWLNDLTKVTQEIKPTSHEITKLLIMLSSALYDGKPLPPYLKPPASFRLSSVLQDLDPDILSAKHFLEPGYASFAVTQVASKLISDDLCGILKRVKNLVGEVDFSFHVVSTNDSDSTLVPEHKGKRD